MAYTPITPTQIQPGGPATTTVMGQFASNADNHESRLQTLEAGGSTTYPPIILRYNGFYQNASGMTGQLKTTLNFALQITGIRLLIDKAGSAGTTQIDIKFKRGTAAWTSLLTTKPSVLYSAGDDALSTNAVLDSSKTTLQAGDLLRLDITSAQTDGLSFLVRIDYNKV